MIQEHISDQLKQFIEESSLVLIMTHDFPDGDAVGSVLALGGFLDSIGKEYRVVFSNLDEEFWAELLPDVNKNRIDANEINDLSADLLFVVDSSNPERIGELRSYLKLFNKIVNIDHHGDNTLFGNLNIVEEASATGEVLYNLFQNFDWKSDSNTATALLVAIISDSGRFQYINTHQGLFRIVADIVELCGMEAYFKVVQALYEQVSVNKLRFFAKIIENLEFFENGVVFSYIEEDVGLAEGLIEQIRSIKGVKVAVLVRRVEDKLKISLRSKDKNYSVRELAGKFGGGGHPGASGATLACLDLPKQLTEIRNTVKEYSENI